MKCPNCGSTRISRYSNNGLTCDNCSHDDRSEAFGVKCTCAQPHHTPMWWCAAHGEVTVPMD